jgi:probable rRNA maturation factor
MKPSKPSQLTLEIETRGVPQGAEALMAAVARSVLEAEGVSGVQVAARLVDDAAMRAINREQRGIDRTTDVLSFPAVAYPAGKTAGHCPRRILREYDPATGLCFLGDLVVSLPRAQAQAASYGHSVFREIGYLTAHGVLHLMGYDHVTQADAEAMRAREERALRGLSLSRGDGHDG